MPTVFQVAKYILEKYDSMTTMKLEKLVYYCQAWSLAWDDVPLFEEDFQAWANGPVCPALFEFHQGLFQIGKEHFNSVEAYQFTESQLETINAVLDYYGDKESQWLSELTHKETPWRQARKGVPDGEACRNIISKESMRQYYGGLV